MKKGILKKMTAIALGAAVAIAMSATAFAATIDNGVATTSDTSVNIPKTLVVTNPTLTSVDGPGLKYDYTVAPETPSANNGGTTVSDGTNTVNVYAGPADSVSLTTDSVEWPVGTAVTASAAGAENTQNIVAEVDVSKFSAPGVYRYKLTESATPSDPSTIGVEDTDAAEVRYMDVYIENNAAGTGLQVSGYVVHTADGTKKSFDPPEYETMNLQVQKSTEGNMADKNHEFPFAITVSDNNRYYYDGEGATVAAAVSQNTTGSSSATLKNGESFWLNGLSSVATVTVTETNNTTDTYTTGVSGKVTVAESAVTPNNSKASGAISMSDSGTVTFTNTLESVSPTGVVLRYGAPILLLLAGIMLVVMHRRSKKALDAE